MHDILFFHHQYDWERQIEDRICTDLDICLPALQLIGTRDIRLNFTNRDDLNQAIDAFRVNTSLFQDLEIDRIEFQYQGEFYIKYSVPALSETVKTVPVECEKTQDILNNITGGRRGGKRQLNRNLWEKLA